MTNDLSQRNRGGRSASASRFRLLSIVLRVLIFSVAALVCFSVPPVRIARAEEWFPDNAWRYRKTITIHADQIPNETLVNFPVLLQATDIDWRDGANGGKVAQADGGDILITAGDGVTKLFHEIESYDPVTGALVAWVKVPVISTSVDTKLYVYYGNAGAVDQFDTTGQVWSNGFASVHHLNEAPSNGVAGHLDSTANGNDGTPQGFGGVAGSTTGAAGKFGGAVELDGVDDRIMIADAASLDLQDEITMSIWFRLDGDSSDDEFPMPFSKGRSDTADGAYGLALNDTRLGADNKAFSIVDAGTTPVTVAQDDAGASYDDAEWHWITGTYSNASNVMRVYLDGVLLQTQAVPGDVKIRVTADNLLIGAGMNDIDRFWNGALDEARVANVSRSSDWITAEFNNQNDPAAFLTVGNQQVLGWYDSDWLYRKRIDVDNALVPDTDDDELLEFPLLINSTDTDWRDTANGGFVGQADGGDFFFTTHDGIRLDHEIETYNNVTGALTAWVRVPVLYADVDTSLYVYYGNTTAPNQFDTTGKVWDENYVGVWHLDESPANDVAGHMDSTSVGNAGTPKNFNGTAQSTTALAGKISGADQFDGTNDYVDVSAFSWPAGGGPVTVSFWNIVLNGEVDQHSAFGVSQAVSGVRLQAHAPWDSNEIIWDYSNGSGGRVTADYSSYRNKWSYVTLVSEGNGGSFQAIYLDGALISEDTGLSVGPAGVMNSLNIGRWRASREHDGGIDEFRISNTVRPADWIQAEYANQNNPASFYTVSAQQTSWYNTDWKYRKKITISAAEVPNTDQTDFPVLIRTTDSSWRVVASGGHAGQADGGDFLFTAADGSTKLTHEIESYTSSTGALVAWVKVPSLSATTNTELYLYYGNASVANQFDTTGQVWTNGFEAVYHLNESPSNGVAGHVDASAKQPNAIPRNFASDANGSTNAVGVIAGADHLGGDNDWIDLGAGSPVAKSRGNITLSGWVKPDTLRTNIIMAYSIDNGGSTTNLSRASIEMQNDGDVQVGGRSNDGESIKTRTTTNQPTATTGQWYYVAGVLNYATNNINIYVNGTLNAASGAPGFADTLTDTTNSTAAAIGSEDDGGSSFSDMFVDEMRAASVSRSADWLRTEYNNQRPSSTFYTVATFEEAAAAVLTSSPGGTVDVTEGGATDTLNLVLYTQPTADVLVTITPDAQVDLGSGAGVAVVKTLTNGNWETPQPVTVTAVDDADIEGPHVSTLSFLVQSADANYQGLFVESVNVNITDDDLPGLSIDDVEVTEGDAGGVAAEFTVTLSGVAPYDVGFSCATADNTATTAGGDYAALTLTPVTIPAGSLTATVTVTVNGDTVDELDETYFVNLSNAVNCTFSDAQGVGTITDDDNATISIDDVTVTEGNAGTVTAAFTVSLSTASDRTVSMNYATADNTASQAAGDYDAISSTVLNITAGNTTGTINVTVNGDTLDELNETFFVNLSAATNATFADSQGLGTITDDDSLQVSIDDVTVTEGNTGTVNAVFTVTLSLASDRDVDINYATANATAAAPGDFTALGPAVLRIDAGDTSGTITVVVNGDTLDELDETFNVNLTGTSVGSISDAVALGTITDDDAAEISISDVTVTEGNAGTVTAAFTVSLSVLSDRDVEVDYATADDSALQTEGDYTAIGATTLTITAGNPTGTINVTVNGDTLDELDETFFVNLSSPVNATIADAQGVGTITDDDAASISINDVTVTEGDAGTVTAAFTVTLSTASDRDIMVDYATANNTAIAASGDYDAITATTLTIFAGDTTGTINVTVNGDTIDESNETYFVNLSMPVNATITDAQGLGTITDDDSATLSVNDVTVTEGNSGDVTATFTVTLSNTSAVDVSVNYATADNTATQAEGDYQTAAGTATILAGQMSTTFDVTINGDTLDEVNETFYVNLSGPVNATITDNQGVGTITDDDQATLSIQDASDTEGNSGTKTVNVVVAMTPAADRDVTFVYTTVDGTATTANNDYQSATDTVTISAGDTSAVIEVEFIGDTLNEPNETFTVVLSAPTVAVIGDDTATVQIQNDDPPGVLVTESGGSTQVTEGGAVDTYTVVLLSQPTANVTVTAQPNTQLTLGAGQGASVDLTFAPGNWFTPQTVTVTAFDDFVAEGLHSGLITHAAASGDGDYDEIGVVDVVPGITDNDSTGVLITQSGGSTQVEEGGVTDSYEIKLNSQPTDAVDITVTPTAQVDLGNGAGVAVVLQFTPGDWDDAQEIEVAAADDMVAENFHNSVIVHAAGSDDLGYDGIPIANVTVGITDNDFLDISISDVVVTEGDAGTVDAVFTVSLAAIGTVDVEVEYATVDGTATTADGDYQVATGTLTIPAGDTTGQIVVSVNGDLKDELNEQFIVQLSDPVNGVLADATGACTITDDDTSMLSIGDVTVTEGNGGSVQAVFTVTASTHSDRTISVNYATADGTAKVADNDYMSTSGALSFAPGQTSKTVSVTVLGDLLDELDETFTVTLSSPGNAGISDGTGLGTITDDDTSQLSIASVLVVEGNSGTSVASFVVSLSLMNDRDVMVQYQTADGTATVANNDYQSASGTLTIPAGSLSGTIQVTIVADQSAESNETMFVNLSSPVNATIAVASATGVIQNDDPPGVLVVESGGSTQSTEGGASDQYTIRLLSSPSATVTVTATPDAQLDLGGGAATPIALLFDSGNWNVPQAVTVVAVDDSIAEGAHAGTVTHLAASADSNYDGIDIVDIHASLLDNDTAGVAVVESAGSTQVTEGGAGDTYTLVLTSQPSANVTVHVVPDAQLNAGAGGATAFSLVFLPGAWNTPKTVTVSAVDDSIDEQIHAGTIVHTVESGDFQFHGVYVAPVAVTIVDNESLGIAVDDVQIVEGNAGLSFVEFTVSLSTVSTSTVTVQYATQNQTAASGDDYVSASGTLTFLPGETAQTVSVAVKGDVLDETDETFALQLSGATNAAIVDAVGVCLIQDDDQASLSISDTSLPEGDSGTTQAHFVLSLDLYSDRDVSVSYATADGTAKVGENDYVAATGTATIVAGQLSTTVTVNVVGDEIDELDEAFLLQLSNPQNVVLSDATASAAILDDDTAEMSINNILVDEGDAGITVAIFTVSLSLPSDRPVSASFATQDGTATTANDDYVALAGTIGIPAGDTSGTIQIDVKGDMIGEFNEYFSVVLSNPFDVVIADGTGVCVIQNDDPPGIVVAQSGGVTAVEEGGATDSYTLKLLSMPTAAVTITVQPDGQVDAGGGPGVAVALEIEAADWDTPVTVTVTANDDDVSEGQHYGLIQHTVDSGDLLYDDYGVADVEVIITDNDDAGFIVAESDGSTIVAEGGVSDTYTIALTSMPVAPVTVLVVPDAQLNAGNGGGMVKVVVFQPADWMTPVTVTVIAVDDNVDEGPHAGGIQYAVQSADTKYQDFALAPLTVSILDNDNAGVVIVESENSTAISEGGAQDTYTIVLSSQPVNTVTVLIQPDAQLSAGGGGAVARQRTFTSGNWNIPATVTVTAVDDQVAEGPHTGGLAHSAQGDAAYAGIGITPVTASITDNDSAGVVIVESGGGTSVDEFGLTDSYTLQLQSEPVAEVTVIVTPPASLDLDAGGGSPVSVVFNAATWNDPVTISVAAVGDDAILGLHVVDISHSVVSADPMYDAISVDDVHVTVRDDELYADAGGDREDLPGYHRLDGSDSFHAGSTALSYQWSQTGGPDVVFGKNAPGVTGFVALLPGVYEFELRVEVGGGLFDVDSVSVTVLDVQPVAVPEGPHVMAVGDSVDLSSAGSFDSNGTPVDAWFWTLAGAGNPVASLDDVFPDAGDEFQAQPRFSPPLPGVYTIALQVDSDGQTSSPVELQIIAVDFDGNGVPPLADAGLMQVVPLNSLVFLDGRNSIDPDDPTGTLAYQWRRISGPAATVNQEDAAVANFMPLTAGVYEFGLTVTDGNDDNLASVESTVIVIAFDPDINTPPTSVVRLLSFDDVNGDHEINVGETLVLSAAKSVDPDGDSLQATWTQLSGPGFYQGSEDATALQFEYQAFLPGLYEFKVVVNDGQSDGPAARISINILPVSGVEPEADARIDGKTELRTTLTASAEFVLDGSRSTGTEGLQFFWRQLYGPYVLIEDRDQEMAVVHVSGDLARVYGFELTVTDANRAKSRAVVWLEVSTFDPDVNPGGNAVPRPKVSAPDFVAVGDTVKIDGRASFDPQDNDGVADIDTGLRLRFVQVGGPLVLITTENGKTFSFKAAMKGAYTFLAFADDGVSLSLPLEFSVVAGKSGGGGGGGSSRCFIATAAFGSPYQPGVRVLRKFRDRYLLPYAWGERLVEFYYAVSPPLADGIAARPWLRAGVRVFLLPLIGFSWFCLQASLWVQCVLLLGFVVAARYALRLRRWLKRSRAAWLS